MCRHFVRFYDTAYPADVAADYIADGLRAGLALERLVDKLAKTHGASVLCAYPVRAFYRDGDVDSLFRISAEHGELEFPATLWVDGQRELSV